MIAGSRFQQRSGTCRKTSSPLGLAQRWTSESVVQRHASILTCKPIVPRDVSGIYLARSDC